MNESKRQLRVAKLLQKELAEILQRELPDLVAGHMVTITKVRVTPDLSLARYYVSVLGSQKLLLVDGLNNARSEMRLKLGQRIRNQLRIVPQLECYLDDSLDYIDNIERLLTDPDQEGSI
ncbi:MAG: 30S ribosome-binding factor RbfA [Sphingobacteriaceae bacterium]|nr:30S ribosome-binding factor RbfA [Sphingobacteriaceae bacterium]